ncbi:hypothetical protein OAF34_01735 [Pirellulaceae bacterium]|nr:hypothetical protein [Pirellulaceae bacterium]
MKEPIKRSIDPLTVFTFLWACQALVHQEFYNGWIGEGNPWGWGLTGVALATLFFPRSIVLFSMMLLTSIIYNVLQWPFVVNHILVETLFNAVLLTAVGWSMLQRNGDGRAAIIDRSAPVLCVSMVVMYYFAILAKLNAGFFDANQSCVVVMFDDLVRRFPLIPNNALTHNLAIGGTIIVELAIPVLLTFKRTQWIAVLLGLGFHVMLGLIGHRTFSGLAFAVYALFLLPGITGVVNDLRNWLDSKVGARTLGFARIALRVVAAMVALLIVGAEWAGRYRDALGPVKIYQIPWLIWILWSLAVALLYCFSVKRYSSVDTSGPDLPSHYRPGFLWLLVPLVFLNGSSQYLGFKTETCFTMYSNLRTEGGVNNHFFMPALRLANYQDDLVQITETDYSLLQKNYLDKEMYITAFEFQRILSNATEDLNVRFVFREEQQEINIKAGVPNEHPLCAYQNPFLAKILTFRPVPQSNGSPCQH